MSTKRPVQYLPYQSRVDDTTAPLQPRKSVAQARTAERILRPNSTCRQTHPVSHAVSAQQVCDHASRRSSHGRLRVRRLRGQTRPGRASSGPAAASAGRRRDAAVRRRGPVGGVRLPERAKRSPARDVYPRRGALDA